MVVEVVLSEWVVLVNTPVAWQMKYNGAKAKGGYARKLVLPTFGRIQHAFVSRTYHKLQVGKVSDKHETLGVAVLSEHATKTTG